MIDVSAFRLLLLIVTAWLDRRERETIAYLIQENRLLCRQLGRRRLQFTDADRLRLAALAHRLGRRLLRDVATVATPDTLLRWHRQLIARKWTFERSRTSRRGVLTEIRSLVIRMAGENPTWGYTRIQGALKNFGHQVGRSTIARILKAHALLPAPKRPTSWQTLSRRPAELLRSRGVIRGSADERDITRFLLRWLLRFHFTFLLCSGAR